MNVNRKNFLRMGGGLAAIIAAKESPAIIRSLVGARSSIVEKTKIPYDAEVAYLESKGMQWIDTGIQPPNSSHVRCNLFLGFASGSYGRRFYFSDGNTSVAHYAEVNAQNRWGTNNSNNLPVINSDTMYYGYAEFTDTAATLGITINGDEFTTATTSFASGSWGGLLLFMLANSYRGNGSRIGKCEITVNGILVRDFIPVRFTNELGMSDGAMYDRVTKKLFRNQGTGSFVIGQDTNLV